MTTTTDIWTGSCDRVQPSYQPAAAFLGRAKRAIERLRTAFGAPGDHALDGLIADSRTLPVIEQELAAIRTIVRFIAKNPAMPVDHRNRFLAMILRSCEELHEALT